MSARPRDFAWGARFGMDWQESAAADLPARDAVLEYLAEIRIACRAWLEGRDDGAMLALDPIYGAEGMSRLELSLYVLRHTHHHLGELCGHLRRCDIARPSWR